MTALRILKYVFFFCMGLAVATVTGSILSKRKPSHMGRATLLAFIGLSLLLVDMFFVEPNWIQVNHVAIHDQKLAEVLKRIKVVHITDLHFTRGIGYREKQLIRKVNALNPDLLLITGDFFDDLSQVELVRQLIRSFKVNIGIFGIPGNTDHIVMDGFSAARELAPAGIDVLVNENRKVPLPNGRILHLAGVDDPTYGHDNLNQAMFGISEDVPTILLAHSPYIFEKAVKQEIDLVLVGHTHGGQIGIPWLVYLSDYANRTPYMRGFFKKNSTAMYVNTGIGMKTLPLRFLCRPEIAVIEVKP
ncbi:MAG: metallophosphoesterase [Candidatus Omnitrophica bacterium]|nr:metallophosphoesterase [Candidatus Omnitrophota bacterium]